MSNKYEKHKFIDVQKKTCKKEGYLKNHSKMVVEMYHKMLEVNWKTWGNEHAWRNLKPFIQNAVHNL